MVNYYDMPYGFSMDMNITDECNIRCEHCYMKKTSEFLTLNESEAILRKIPSTLSKLVISGGEPFLNYDVMYYTISIARHIFDPNLVIRICTNGKYFYETDQSIVNELLKLDDYGVNELLISTDKYHFAAGIDSSRLQRISEICLSMNKRIKVKFLDIGNGAPIGEFKERKKEKIDKKECLNRNYNIFRPYLFSATDGDVFLCAYRGIPKIGTLKTDSWKTIAQNILGQYEFLSGNIISTIVKQEGTSDTIYELYQKYGECYLCQKYYWNK